MSKPREFRVRQFHWNDGDVTYDIVPESYEDIPKAPSFRVREITPADQAKDEIKPTCTEVHKEDSRVIEEQAKEIDRLRQGYEVLRDSLKRSKNYWAGLDYCNNNCDKLFHQPDCQMMNDLFEALASAKEIVGE